MTWCTVITYVTNISLFLNFDFLKSFTKYSNLILCIMYLAYVHIYVFSHSSHLILTCLNIFPFVSTYLVGSLIFYKSLVTLSLFCCSLFHFISSLCYSVLSSLCFLTSAYASSNLFSYFSLFFPLFLFRRVVWVDLLRPLIAVIMGS